MVDVVTEIEINAPLEKVAEYAMQPDNAPKWYENIESAEWKTQPPLSVGSQIAFIARFMGRKLSYIYEVTEMSNSRFIMHTSEGPFPMETIYTWESLGPSQTKMTLRNRGNPEGFSKLFAPFMVPLMRRAVRKDLKRIKAILENN